LFVVGPSVAATLIGYGAPTTAVGTVVGVIATVAEPVAVALACDVAVTVADVGSPTAIVGAVYAPAFTDPPLLGETLHVTVVLLVFVTVAVKVAVCDGQFV
jgi:hypothetical protein